MFWTNTFLDLLISICSAYNIIGLLFLEYRAEGLCGMSCELCVANTPADLSIRPGAELPESISLLMKVAAEFDQSLLAPKNTNPLYNNYVVTSCIY